MSKPQPLAGPILVSCALCAAVVDNMSARQRQIATPAGIKTVWVCLTCLHLGSEEATRKYIMKEQKTVGR